MGWRQPQPLRRSQRLALRFAGTHPPIDEGIRAPLILRVVLGLDAKVIASSFLMFPAAMSKRLVRAKDKIRQAGIPFRVPEREELAGRLDTCWTLFMPPLPKAGPIRAEPMLRVAI